MGVQIVARSCGRLARGTV